MRSSYLASLEFTLNEEGGFADHPEDPGGATMRGVTKATYEKWLGREVTIAELKAIPFQHIGEIYLEDYWLAVTGDELPRGIDAAVFDFAVNSGKTRATKYIQHLAGATKDGVIGPKSLAAIEALVDKDGAKAVIGRYIDERRSFLRGLRTFKTFGKGWMARCQRLEDFAKGLAG